MSNSEVENTTKQEKISAYAAIGVGQALQSYEYIPKELGSLEIEIAISHCGICHSDLHLIKNDWSVSLYPLVPGHEIIGTVARIGSAVGNLRVGQRVGVGWFAGACFECEMCRLGEENLCAAAQATCVGREGGYATRVRVDFRFAFLIPDSLPSEYAAPLLCAGITVFAPLHRHGLNKATRLGVVGIGGLGHLALQYGHTMGCHVTAFSSSAAKAEEAKRLGADEFVDTSPKGAVAGRANTCDFLLSTVPADLPWGDYVNVLRPNGRLCIVGAPANDLKLSAFPLIVGQKSVVGITVGSNSEMRQMLAFSAQHNVRPQIEMFSMPEVNQALERLRQNQLRYRAVLANQ
jgi:uncharacterized zinc-type alcohol dehydrogenase-like protein